ncbi:MAG: ABC transporter ATP-binding protein [Proteobacteria bacterium]|uniref:ABC transporter ATP-binding protein n=1 Tax=Rudaea sp. TaxID=2136325 RepID=UPI001D69BD05|nr:ABC transporter ATP-binding protein [Pseudomonadota bacterium]MBS0567905.1 ABC transporter ATP-binding protein [Pseudomonadota bacterium]
MSNLISMKNVDLSYASTAFKERSLKTAMTNLLRPKNRRIEVQDIKALKNVSVDIRSGERVGLLGHNGAGKSTFLKVVAGLYPISAGTRTVRGVVRSMFDLSLGFEPDATGRENILYRGLLLGLTPKFMRAIEDEVVAFADLGEFIDYPIKTYSAGMLVRLAFAITTAVGGDVLLLDEVIGAGDANFMLKARQRIRELIEKSEVLLLASHDFATLRSTCERGLVFHHGELRFDGAMDACIDEYKQLNGLAQ